MKFLKRNLIVCWFGMFVTMIGMSQIAPVLPLYIRQLGIHDTSSIEKLSGIAFGATYIFSAIFSPIWGKFADKSWTKTYAFACKSWHGNYYILYGLCH